MKKSEAATNLRNMMLSIQKYRSVTRETFGTLPGADETLASIWPWTFGDKCPLPAISKVLDAYDTDGTLAPMDYYNMMTVLHRFMPEVIPMFVILGAEIPPTPTFTMEWDDES